MVVIPQRTPCHANQDGETPFIMRKKKTSSGLDDYQNTLDVVSDSRNFFGFTENLSPPLASSTPTRVPKDREAESLRDDASGSEILGHFVSSTDPQLFKANFSR